MKIPYTSIEVRIPGFILRHKIVTSVVVGILVVFVLPAYLLSRPKQPTYVTATATVADLVQTVEAVGTVTSEKDLDLEFKTPGIVSDVLVKEGDKVRAGQRLAGLRAGGIGASIASAQASVQEAQAQLDALLQGARPEELAIEQANLDNKKAALAAAQQSLQTATDNLNASQGRLDALKHEIEITQAGDVSLTPSTITQKITAAQQAISATQDVLRNNDLQDAIARANPGDYYLVAQDMTNIQADFTAALSVYGVNDTTSAVAALQKARLVVSKATGILDRVFAVLAQIQPNSYLTVTNLNAYKTTVSTQRTALQTAGKDLDNAIQDLQQAPASLSTRLATEQANYDSAKGSKQRAQSDILTYQTAVNIEAAQLALKKAPPRQTDISAAQARVNQARASLAAAAGNYSDTLITAPVDGVITKVAVKAGEPTPLGTAIGMMGESPYRIEMFVSEVDVPKVQKTQSGSIKLDAFRTQSIPLRVAEIDQSATDKDGVPKYRVKLDFVTPRTDVKIGMTGDAEIITGMKAKVLTVPRRAVLDSSVGSGSVVRVLAKDGALVERPVIMGMEGGNGDVEILSGLTEGDTIVVLVKQ